MKLKFGDPVSLSCIELTGGCKQGCCTGTEPSSVHQTTHLQQPLQEAIDLGEADRYAFIAGSSLDVDPGDPQTREAK